MDELFQKTAKFQIIQKTDADEPDIKPLDYIILKRKFDPKTGTEVIIKLNGKTRYLFMIKPGELEEEITHLFNPHDKRVFDNVFYKLRTQKL